MGHKTSWNIHVYSDLKARAKKDNLPISEMVNKLLLDYYPDKRREYLKERIARDKAELAELDKEFEEIKVQEEVKVSNVDGAMDQAILIHDNTMNMAKGEGLVSLGRRQGAIGLDMIQKIANDNNTSPTLLKEKLEALNNGQAETDKRIWIYPKHPEEIHETKIGGGGRDLLKSDF